MPCNNPRKDDKKSTAINPKKRPPFSATLKDIAIQYKVAKW